MISETILRFSITGFNSANFCTKISALEGDPEVLRFASLLTARYFDSFYDTTENLCYGDFDLSFTGELTFYAL